MPSINQNHAEKLPGRFEDLVGVMPPQAIMDEVDYDNAVAMIDRLMRIGKPTPGQSLYMETLVQLVQAYEAAHHAIDTWRISGLDSLRHLLDENRMSAADLARLLGVHPSTGSKLLKGQRPLTVDHLKKLGERFRVRPELFID